MKHNVRVKNWDGEVLELEVEANTDDLRKIAKLAHSAIGKHRDKKGKPFKTYCISKIDGKIPPADVMCG